MTQHAPTITHDGSFVRFPGLLRRWEIEDVVVPGVTFRVEEAGTTSDGCQLFALYWLKGVDSRDVDDRRDPRDDGGKRGSPRNAAPPLTAVA